MNLSRLKFESINKLDDEGLATLMEELVKAAKENPENIWIRMGLENCCQVCAMRIAGQSCWGPTYRSISESINRDLQMPGFLGKKVNDQLTVTAHFVGETILNVAETGKAAVTGTYLALRKIFGPPGK